MSQLYIGNIGSNTRIQDLVREFEPYGEIRRIKIPTNNYAFVEYKNRSDALIAIQSWNGKFNWLVNFSHHSQGVATNNCSFCWGFGHVSDACPFAQSKVSVCTSHSNGGGSGSGVYLPSNCDFDGGFGDFDGVFGGFDGVFGGFDGVFGGFDGVFGDFDGGFGGFDGGFGGFDGGFGGFDGGFGGFDGGFGGFDGVFGDFDGDCISDYGKDMKNKGVKRLKEKEVASVRAPSPPWLELPGDITEKILSKLGPVGILLSAQFVCTTWRKICRDPTMWRVIDMWKLGDVHSLYCLGPFGLWDVLTRAVDLSQGQATEINIDYFGCDHHLEYIAERCGNLRFLRLAFCEGVSGRTLSKTVKRFPLLEELHLHCVPIRKRFVEAIGQACPMLKTFALNRGRGYDGDLRCSDDALAIAKSMPELHHLQLFGNRLTNEVLEAILNGCPKLESLDLRQCYNLNIQGELAKRCAQQIKILLRPRDSIQNYAWLPLSGFWEHCYREDVENRHHEEDDDEYYSESDDDQYDSNDYEYDDLSDPDQSDGGSDESGFDE